MQFQTDISPVQSHCPRFEPDSLQRRWVVNYASAPCGSGKTHQIVNRACQLAYDDRRVLILQPTLELIDRTIEQELLSRERVPANRVFHGEEVSGSVAGELTRYFNSPEDAGQVIFATHQVLPYIPYFANKADWHLMVDEEMQVLRYHCHRLPKTHALITDDIDLVPYNSIYSEVAPRNAASLKAKRRNKEEDELLAHLANTIQVLTNRYWSTYVNTEQYERLRHREIQTLAFHSILKPEIIHGFGSVFMAAANFEDTALYQLWSPTHEFQPDRKFWDSLRFSQHQNGNLITIYYAMDEQWSRKRAQTDAGEGGNRNIRDLLNPCKPSKVVRFPSNLSGRRTSQLRAIHLDRMHDDCPTNSMD